MKLLSVGRIAPVKNYEVLLEAAKILKNQHIDFSVTVVGEPALQEDKQYMDRLKRESAGLHFEFVGKKTQQELPAIYRSHDIFVHMSQTGSLDKTILEAMACGMRVVSCNDASRGFLPASWIFSPHDAQELAEKIIHPKLEHFDGRDYVVRHHDVKKLIEKISSLL